MIISHERKFVFVKTLKVGGTSLEMALSRLCGRDDVIGPLEPEEEVFRKDAFNGGARNHLRPTTRLMAAARKAMGRRPQVRFREHMPAWQIREEIGAALWTDYFTFTIVRNPFDRCVSRYYHSLKYAKRSGAFTPWTLGSFEQYLRYGAEVINENWRIYTVDDRPIVDFCVRYEHLEADLAEVSRRIGLETNLYDDMKLYRMKGDSRPSQGHYSELISPRYRDLIATLCAEEIRLYGYEFDDRAHRAGVGADRTGSA